MEDNKKKNFKQNKNAGYSQRSRYDYDRNVKTKYSQEDNSNEDTGLVIGRNAVRELLKSERAARRRCKISSCMNQ